LQLRLADIYLQLTYRLLQSLISRSELQYGSPLFLQFALQGDLLLVDVLDFLILFLRLLVDFNCSGLQVLDLSDVLRVLPSQVLTVALHDLEIGQRLRQFGLRLL
jgi:hypothetical protein